MTWAGSASVAEDERVSRTERMVRQSLEGSRRLARTPMTFLSQGSAINNTNVRLESDLDLVVMATGFIWSVPYFGESLSPLSVTTRLPLESAYADLHRDVLGALTDSFRDSGVVVGAKSIKLSPTETTRVACDVVPCFRLRQMKPRSQWLLDVPQYLEGVVFRSSNRETIYSYPEQHLKNGRAKNIATAYRYKQIVRVLKKFCYEIKSRQSPLMSEELPSSFQIECLVYNVPTSVLSQGDLYDASLATLEWTKRALSDPVKCNGLIQVNGVNLLFDRWGLTLLTGNTNEPPGVANARRFVKRVQEFVHRVP